MYMILDTFDIGLILFDISWVTVFILRLKVELLPLFGRFVMIFFIKSLFILFQ